MLNETLTRYTELTDAALKTYLSLDSIPADLREAMAYSVFAGGKRLRPALLLASCEAAGGNLAEALPFACAMEMIHTYSLIHDDLPALDNDDYRRGRLTSHKKFGEDRAILTGDALLSYAFEVMADATDTKGKIEATRDIVHAAGASRMVAGQWVDVTLNGQVFDAETMHYIHMNKTAAMILGALAAGAHCAGADMNFCETMTAYGREIGYTFQIIDDILDVEGDAALLGKSTGSDSANGKTTYVTLYGVEGAREEAKKHTEQAKAIVEFLGDRAGFFRELADYLLTRKK